jgi:hypothetical protein
MLGVFFGDVCKLAGRLKRGREGAPLATNDGRQTGRSASTAKTANALRTSTVASASASACLPTTVSLVTKQNMGLSHPEARSQQPSPCMSLLPKYWVANAHLTCKTENPCNRPSVSLSVCLSASHGAPGAGATEAHKL